ncbi:hypothetical protein [Burkholderia territorii]|nr:hypothetical protein [Burkholderia territorii]
MSLHSRAADKIAALARACAGGDHALHASDIRNAKEYWSTWQRRQA